MSKVQEFYDDHVQDELGRLDRHRTEFAVSLRVMREYLSPPPSMILDIGGGPGRYAVELASQGYTVSMADLSTESLRLARDRAETAGVTITGFHQTDARDLQGIRDSSFDAALLMGPLYHLQQKEERREAVQAAKRILKPGGRIFAAFITRFAPFRNAAAVEPEWLVDQKKYAFELLETGVHDQGQHFPHAYFAHPNEIIPMMENSDFETDLLIGCEGIVSGLEEMINTYEGEAWETWVEMNYRLGKEPTLFGASDHLLYVGRKTT